MSIEEQRRTMVLTQVVTGSLSVSPVNRPPRDVDPAERHGDLNERIRAEFIGRAGEEWRRRQAC